MPEADGYYRADLARIHHEGFGFHADACAPGILAFLEPVLAAGGLVVEVGCGSGLLTKHLTDAGHRVLATDASAAMVALARAHAPEAVGHEVRTLPDDDLPAADAVVSTGHVLSYLDSRERLLGALRVCAAALGRGGRLALDLEDLSTRTAQMARGTGGFIGDDWALVTRRISDGPDHYARDMTFFVRESDGRYRRGHERHDNVLIDVHAEVGPLLAELGFAVEIGPSFGAETNMEGLMVVKALRTATP